MHIGGALSRQRTGVRTMHLAEVLAAAPRELPEGRERHAARLAAAPQPRQGDPHDPRQARGVVGELPDWAELRARAGR